MITCEEVFKMFNQLRRRKRAKKIQDNWEQMINSELGDQSQFADLASKLEQSAYKTTLKGDELIQGDVVICQHYPRPMMMVEKNEEVVFFVDLKQEPVPYDSRFLNLLVKLGLIRQKLLNIGILGSAAGDYQVLGRSRYEN